eukprot:2769862-Rhodomonas_salina.7
MFFSCACCEDATENLSFDSSASVTSHASWLLAPPPRPPPPPPAPPADHEGFCLACASRPALGRGGGNVPPPLRKAPGLNG